MYGLQACQWTLVIPHAYLRAQIQASCPQPPISKEHSRDLEIGLRGDALRPFYDVSRRLNAFLQHIPHQTPQPHGMLSTQRFAVRDLQLRFVRKLLQRFNVQCIEIFDRQSDKQISCQITARPSRSSYTLHSTMCAATRSVSACACKSCPPRKSPTPAPGMTTTRSNALTYFPSPCGLNC